MLTLVALASSFPAPQPAFDRRASVSTTGRVASTTPSGTFVTGRGRVAEGGTAVSWSPDGQVLAIAMKVDRVVGLADGRSTSVPEDKILFWPSGPSLDHPYGLGRPLAWSHKGDRLAGSQAGGIGVFSMPDGKAAASYGPASGRHKTDGGYPSRLRWTDGGRLMAVLGNAIYLDEKLVVQRDKAILIDAVPVAGGVVWLESDAPSGTPPWVERPPLTEASPLRIGRWNAGDGTVSLVARGRFSDFLASGSSRRFALPRLCVLAQDGRRGVVSGLVVESGARAILRLRALLGKAAPTAAEAAERERLLRAARKTSVVARADANGGHDTVWTNPVTSLADGVTDLAYSPDGRWLAIARKDGTVRVAAGE